MTVLKSFRELDAWKRAVILARKSYLVARRLPVEERFELSSQIRRAAISIPANIAEGYGRRHRKEYLQFLSIASASLAELQTLFILTVELGLIQRGFVREAYAESNEVGKLLTRLQRALRPDPIPDTRNPS